MKEVRIGQVLIEQGVLNSEQVDAVLAQQVQTARPFGVLCEEMFNLDPEVIESAWSEQYARLTPVIDPESEQYDPSAQLTVTRRQAWQFCVLPIRYDGDELMIATLQSHLLRALRFACNVLEQPAYLVLAEPEALGRALTLHYPLPGMTPGLLARSGNLQAVPTALQ